MMKSAFCILKNSFKLKTVQNAQLWWWEMRDPPVGFGPRYSERKWTLVRSNLQSSKTIAPPSLKISVYSNWHRLEDIYSLTFCKWGKWFFFFNLTHFLGLFKIHKIELFAIGFYKIAEKSGNTVCEGRIWLGAFFIHLHAWF